MPVVSSLLRLLLQSRATLAVENPTLCQQVALLHLLRVIREYFAYSRDSRPYQSLDRNAPRPREIEPPSQGRILAEPQAAGLHHRYRRAA